MKDIQKLFKSVSKGIALLIDPEKADDEAVLQELLKKADFAGIDFLFVGGSTVTREQFERTVHTIKKYSSLPLVIFPGSSQQLSPEADAILFLSLISGRNPDYLIGHQVQSAPELFEMAIEVIPTGYILIDGDTQSSVAYVSQTTPIPRNNITIVKHTAMAGILLGQQLIYLDAGSGAKEVVPQNIIASVANLTIPIIVGGGIRSAKQIQEAHASGAAIVVIGNHIEKHLDFLLDIQLYKSEQTLNA